MKNKHNRPDIEKVLSTLKDFQLETVDYVFRRMYKDEDYTRRFLIADEVGLGKTLVARGVIAKAIDHLWDKVRRIDIVYICSNADIARQNINRLNITDTDECEIASRITLLPIQYSSLKENAINLVSFTPGTSFDQKSNLGVRLERALLYWMLKDAWNITGKGPLNVLQGNVRNYKRFRKEVYQFKHEYEIDKNIKKEFARVLNSPEQNQLKERFEKICCDFRNPRAVVPYTEREERNDVIGNLRALLARTCLQHLEPDLIILDEFQRFKHLLDTTTEAGQLAHKLFDYSDEHSEARVIMLSATPYKMYTLSAMEETENHYEDFLNTYQFLTNNDAKKGASFDGQLLDYREKLLTFNTENVSPIVQAKNLIETALKKVMVRTERLAITENRNGMLVEKPSEGFSVEAGDILSYVAVEKIAKALEENDVLEYWKSAPYLFNFMDDYSVKQKLKDALKDRVLRNRVVKLFSQNPVLKLLPEEIKNYKKIDPQNARLRSLLNDVSSSGVWKLLWIPPSLPYYQLGETFQTVSEKGFTKRLVFSAWKLVPKVIATLVSYEVERLISLGFEESSLNTKDVRDKRGQLLRFARTSGRLTGMPVVGLIYPAMVLASECDPLKYYKQYASQANSPSLEGVLSWVIGQIKNLLEKLAPGNKSGGQVDERWYWAAPILFDLQQNKKTDAKQWLCNDNLAAVWSGGLDNNDEQSAWADHVDEVKKLVHEYDHNQMPLGRMPNDLPTVLAKIALASPGVCALRAMSRSMDEAIAMRQLEVKNASASTAWSFLTLFNSYEATSLIRSIDKREPYWERVLDYSMNGCLQSVLDEFFHMLLESEGLSNKPIEVIAKGIAEAVHSAITLRTARLYVDDISDIQGSTLERIENFGRARFALRFDNEDSDSSTEPTRADQVRDAFNSPFWPFVLATTSVGQEGLDFHPYCHAVVHWNLPSNPVDLEQREGRVHRYKGHAVRKNIAVKFGDEVLRKNVNDIWNSLFQLAKDQRPKGKSDLIPFWLYPLENGAFIERYVPAFPLSRESEKILDLKRSLAVYRMVFGQSRQQDLVDLLLNRLPNVNGKELVDLLRIDLSPS
ncbi:MAG: helicase-related protein [Bacteroidota bacterium]